MARPHRHGTRYAYQRRRCRCPLCREWKRLEVELYRRRNPTAEAARRKARTLKAQRRRELDRAGRTG